MMISSAGEEENDGTLVPTTEVNFEAVTVPTTADEAVAVVQSAFSSNTAALTAVRAVAREKKEIAVFIVIVVAWCNKEVLIVLH